MKRGTDAVGIVYIVVIVTAGRIQIVSIVAIIVVAGAQPDPTVKTKLLPMYDNDTIVYAKNQVI